MIFFIETPRLILRDIRPSDAEDFFRMDSQPQVHRYLGNQPVQNIEHIKVVIENLRKQYEENGIARWAVIEKSSGNFIGWSGLKYITEPENNKENFYDVGYRLHPDYWGKGYATESAKAAIEYGFTHLRLKEIIGSCHEENKASRKALEKCGLIFVEKFMYKENLPCDWLLITKERWEALQNS